MTRAVETAGRGRPRTRLDHLPPLHGGGWSARLDDAGLRDLRWHGLDVAARLHMPLRDATWGTPVPLVEACEVTSGADGFTVTLRVSHPEAALSWRGTITAEHTGHVRVDVEATAHADLDVRRWGPVLLLSPRWCGARWQTQLDDEYPATGRLPHLVAPQPITWRADGSSVLAPLVPTHTWATLSRPGLDLEMLWTGDVAEVEDQRNWADCSFKVHTGRVSDRDPHRMAAGQTLACILDLQACTPRSPEVSVVDTGLPLADGPDRITITAAVDDDAWRARVRGTVEHDIACDLHLIGDLDDDWTSALTELRQALDGPPLASLWVHERDHASGRPGECTPKALVEHVGEVAREVGLRVDAVGGGSLASFTELVRHPVDHLSAVCFGLDPTVHAADVTSILETPRTVSAMADTLVEIAPGAVIHWGPLGRADGEPLPATWWTAMLGAICTTGADAIVPARHDALVTEVARHAGHRCWDASPAAALTASVTAWQHEDHVELVACDLSGQGQSLPLDIDRATCETWTGSGWSPRPTGLTSPGDSVLDLAPDEIVRVRLRRGVDSPSRAD